MNLRLLSTLYLTIVLTTLSSVFAEDGQQKLVVIAGKPSHPPRMHEFNAGVQLLDKCLKKVPGLQVEIVLNGWPQDESDFEDADAVVFYMDGGGRHEVVQENGRRLKLIDELTSKGVGIGCMHYGVEVLKDQAGPQFKRWIGGYYENSFSCNPIWEPVFNHFEKHPITQGVEPFQIKDEWYFNMRFISDVPGNKPGKLENTSFVPILVASPDDEVRDGPYVYPRGPYEHIQQAKGRRKSTSRRMASSQPFPKPTSTRIWIPSQPGSPGINKLRRYHYSADVETGLSNLIGLLPSHASVSGM